MWLPWVDLFDRNGYDSLVILRPLEPATAAECRADPSYADGGTLRRLLAQVQDSLVGARRPAILVGHGVGGSVTRMLLRDPAVSVSAAVVVSPAPTGPLSPESARHLGHLATRLSPARRLKMAGFPDQAAFDHWYTNAATKRTAAFYRQYLVPASSRPLFEVAIRAPSAHVTGGPMLLLSGGRDRLFPERTAELLLRRRRRHTPDAITDYQVFPDRGHSLVFDDRWDDVANFSLDWLTRQQL
jgi:non-heme chloroperoxidase